MELVIALFFLKKNQRRENKSLFEAVSENRSVRGGGGAGHGDGKLSTEGLPRLSMTELLPATKAPAKGSNMLQHSSKVASVKD